MTPMPVWKRALIFLVCAWGLLAAAPNLNYLRVEKHNDAAALAEKGLVLTAEQEQARGLWPGFLPSALVNLGLDLRGGVHLLAEVALEDVYGARMDRLWPELRDELRALRSQIGTIRRQQSAPDELRVSISRPEGMSAALAAARALASPVVSLGGAGQKTLEVTSQGSDLIVSLSQAERAATDTRTIEQSLEIIRRRVDEAGTREPTIQRQGDDRILIQVPGIGSAGELKDLIGTTAQLTFHPVVGRSSDPATRPGARQLLLPELAEKGGAAEVFYLIEQTPVVTGEDLVDAQPTFDENNRPAVSFRFNPSGARAFGDYTAANVGQPFAIVLDAEVISAPVIQTHISGGSGIITGSFTVEESNELAVLLRAGALPAKMNFLEERTIGPELGQDSIDAGKVAALIALVAVAVFIIASYGLFGVFAAIALAINIALIFAALSTIGATLTLPGIAGIVLTIGMAVDANVLVFERIREELGASKRPGRAVELGYERAFSAILDANITTFIVAVILFTMGAGPVRGFAVTLGIGILTSIFTALSVTRVLVELWLNRARPANLTL